MDTYDFVVVGAGTAGCVLAARLSERPDVKVLLIEAGSDEVPAAMVEPPKWPALHTTMAGWGDMTTPQGPAAVITPLPRGKVVGGSSAINGMVFVRGHRLSYDTWADAGAKGWGFDDLLPYFMRSENAPGRDPQVRGLGGPLTVAPADPTHPVLSSALEAVLQTGQSRAADISSGLEEGFGPVDLNIVGGRRQSAADAYLADARGRKNLRIVSDAQVQRLTITDGRCTGLEYLTAGGQESVSAGEVVLTAGAIASPQLLMLSGVGPARDLRPLGVDVHLDLPGVGANLQDHPTANVVYRSRREIPAAHNNHGEIIGLLRSAAERAEPDLQLILIDLARPVAGYERPQQGYTIGASVMRPYSRGSVRLAGTDVRTAPLIDPGYYSDRRDLDTAVAGLRLARRIGEAAALDGWRDAELAPGAGVLDDDEALRAYARRTVASYCHVVGTCALGSGDDAVVDDELRVHGIAGLRIADGSVMPQIPSANTNATVYAIAERAASLIAG